MLFHEESTGRTARFDCSDLPVTEPVRRWLVEVLAERASARSGVKRVTSFRSNSFQVVRYFAQALSSSEWPPERPSDIGAEHIRAYRALFPDAQAQRAAVQRLRVLLRDRADLPGPARNELFGTRLPTKKVSEQVTAYPEHEWQQIMTALRRDVRLSRDRIRAGVRLLNRFRAGELKPDSPDAELGVLLDCVMRTGDLPRQLDGGGTPEVKRHGGVVAVTRMLTLSQQEASAFALLLSILTADNIGTVAQWPAVQQRPSGLSPAGRVVLLEQRKPRRGPDREHRVAALEDLPVSLKSALEKSKGDDPLFHSPLRLYELLLELTSPARLITGSTSAFVHRRNADPSGKGMLWSEDVRIERWARTRGFPPVNRATKDGPPGIDARRVRQTALEIQQRPVSHTRRTLRDHYLQRSRTVREQSQDVVAETLREQVAKAQDVAEVPVFTRRLLSLAAEDLNAAAAEAGLDPLVLKSMLAGERDTAVVACRDHRDSPHAPRGQTCPVSFLSGCLNCPNARALPHQLPVQIILRDRLEGLRLNMDPQTWEIRYAAPLARLRDILGHYSEAEHERARASATERHSSLIDTLLEGRTDLR